MARRKQHPNDVALGQRVRTLRLQAGMTLRAVAAMATHLGTPLSQTALGEVERGRRSLTALEAVGVARVIGVSVGHLLDVAP